MSKQILNGYRVARYLALAGILTILSGGVTVADDPVYSTKGAAQPGSYQQTPGGGYGAQDRYLPQRVNVGLQQNKVKKNPQSQSALAQYQSTQKTSGPMSFGQIAKGLQKKDQEQPMSFRTMATSVKKKSPNDSEKPLGY